MDVSRRNVLVLSICQALLFANSATLISVAGLAGRDLAADKSLATLPVTASVLGAALTAFPASLLMKRIGRRAGFMLGATLGLFGIAAGALALQTRSFPLFCGALLLFGAYGGFAQYYRFAAADTAPENYKSTAISMVLAGGLVGGLIGPEVGKLTVDLLPVRYLGTFAALAVYVVFALAILLALRIPKPAGSQEREHGRPLRVIAAQPKFIVAVVGAALGYGVMNFLMVATPLAMESHGHGFAASAFVIQWHVVAMFAPSFVTGWLIKRFGVPNVLFAGTAALAGCIATAIADTTVAHYWFALVLLGIGWNFLYTGGTTLLTETHRPEERAKTQGVNDLIVFSTQALTSLASGWMLELRGWKSVNLFAAVLVMIIVATTGLLSLKRARPALTRMR